MGVVSSNGSSEIVSSGLIVSLGLAVALAEGFGFGEGAGVSSFGTGLF
jgi:hypothetical protein